jgi:hypothetical protein
MSKYNNDFDRDYIRNFVIDADAHRTSKSK